MFKIKANASEYYAGLITLSVAVGFLTDITTAFIVLGVGTMVASFIEGK